MTTEGDEVLGTILPRTTAKLFVMHLKISTSSARLAAPAVALKDCTPKPPVFVRCETQHSFFESKYGHEALSTASSKNFCRCSPGKNLKKFFIDLSKMSAFALSKFAPARKSAQIISKQ
jgi:hypothetical protein